MTTTPADTTDICRTGFVLHAHDTGENSHIICLDTCDCGKPSILPALFQDGEVVTLTLKAPAEDDPRGAPSDHPRLDIHINPGDELHHDPCLVFDTCGPCFTHVWETVFANGGGRIGVHAFPEDPDTLLFAPFRIENWKQTREAVQIANSRLTAN